MNEYIGIKEADGKIKPLFKKGQRGRFRLICSPEQARQKQANLDFFVVKKEVDTENRYIGTVVIDNLKQYSHKPLEVLVSMDEKGLLETSLRPLYGTGKQSFNVIFKPRAHVAERTEKLKSHDLLSPHTVEIGKGEEGGKQGSEPVKKGIKALRSLFYSIYGLFITGLLFFLITQTFPALSLEQLFGIRL